MEGNGSQGLLTECVAYEPSKSVSFGHKAHVNKVREAVQLLQEFLDRHTIFTLDRHVQLQCMPPSSAGEATTTNEFQARAQEILGDPTEKGRAEWRLGPEQLPQILAVALEEDRWPRQPLGPAWLTYSYDFQWKEAPMTVGAAALWRSSWLHIIISAQRMFIQPRLIFPWPYTSPMAREFILRVSPDLPIRIRPQYFKRLLPAKKGGYRALKLSANWLDDA